MDSTGAFLPNRVTLKPGQAAQLMKPAFSTSSTKPTTKKQRFSRRKLANPTAGAKGGLTITKVDPAALQALFEATKRDSNRNLRYSIPTINNRLCR